MTSDQLEGDLGYDGSVYSSYTIHQSSWLEGILDIHSNASNNIYLSVSAVHVIAE